MTTAERDSEIAYWRWVSSKWSERGDEFYADMAAEKALQVEMGANNGWEADDGCFNRHKWREECSESRQLRFV